MTDTALRYEFYQLGRPVFERLPKVRAPLAYYRLDEKGRRVEKFADKGEFLPRDLYLAIARACDDGVLLVSRDERDAYIEVFCKRPQMVLADPHLLPEETALILHRGLSGALDDFFRQPLNENLATVARDVRTVVEWLIQDQDNVRFLKEWFGREASLVPHCIAAMAAGLGLSLADRSLPPHRESLERLALGLVLHDLGLTKVPGFILGKQGPLKMAEMESVRQHPLAGARMLQSLSVEDPVVFQCVIDHHERVDGSGYPRGVSGERLTRPGRIAGLADSFAAMTTDRAYAAAVPPGEAVHLLARDHARYDRLLARALVRFVLVD